MKNEWFYLAAIQAANPDNYLSFERIENPEFAEDIVDMSSYGPMNPEQILLKKEKWELLREETKQVIELIVNCPAEVLYDILGTRRRSMKQSATDRLTLPKITKYLKRQWEGDQRTINIVMKEIRQFIRS